MIRTAILRLRGHSPTGPNGVAAQSRAAHQRPRLTPAGQAVVVVSGIPGFHGIIHKILHIPIPRSWARGAGRWSSGERPPARCGAGGRAMSSRSGVIGRAACRAISRIVSRGDGRRPAHINERPAFVMTDRGTCGIPGDNRIQRGRAMQADRDSLPFDHRCMDVERIPIRLARFMPSSRSDRGRGPRWPHRGQGDRRERGGRGSVRRRGRGAIRVDDDLLRYGRATCSPQGLGGPVD